MTQIFHYQDPFQFYFLTLVKRMASYRKYCIRGQTSGMFVPSKGEKRESGWRKGRVTSRDLLLMSPAIPTSFGAQCTSCSFGFCLVYLSFRTRCSQNHTHIHKFICTIYIKYTIADVSSIKSLSKLPTTATDELKVQTLTDATYSSVSPIHAFCLYLIFSFHHLRP